MDIAKAQQYWRPQPGWLNTASYGLPPEPGWDAMMAALADWRVGRTSWEGWDQATQASRETFARLSSLRLPDRDGYVQGEVARVGARVFVDGGAIRVFVPAYWGTHLLERVRYVEEAS